LAFWSDQDGNRRGKRYLAKLHQITHTKISILLDRDDELTDSVVEGVRSLICTAGAAAFLIHIWCCDWRSSTLLHISKNEKGLIDRVLLNVSNN